MILYLAGLKALDPALREAAAIDGASEGARSSRSSCPALKPINIVLVVITVIEALRAFDIVYIINRGRNGLELLSVLDHRQHHRRGEPDRLRLGDRGRPADDLDRPDRDLRLEQLPGVARHDERGGRDAARRVARSARRTRPSRVGLHAFLIVTVAPLDRRRSCGRSSPRCGPYADTAQHGYVSWPQALQPHELHERLDAGAACRTTSGTRCIVAVPAIVLILLFSSAVAFVVSRFSFWFNVPLLIFFMAANLLPQQVILQPLYRAVPPDAPPVLALGQRCLLRLVRRADRDQRGVPDRLLHVRARQLHEDDPEVADARRRASTARASCASTSGSSCRSASRRSRRWRRSSSPSSTTSSSGPLILVSSGSKLPITAALNNLQGEFFTDNNLLAAAALLTALPTLARLRRAPAALRQRAHARSEQGMTRIAFIGAGSVVFTKNLLGDILELPGAARGRDRAPRHRPRSARDRRGDGALRRARAAARARRSARTSTGAPRSTAPTSCSTWCRSAGTRRRCATSRSRRATACARRSATRSASAASSARCAPPTTCSRSGTRWPSSARPTPGS